MRALKQSAQLANFTQFALTVTHCLRRNSRVGSVSVPVPLRGGCDCFCPKRLFASIASRDWPHADSRAASQAAYSGKMCSAAHAAAYAFSSWGVRRLRLSIFEAVFYYQYFKSCRKLRQ